MAKVKRPTGPDAWVEVDRRPEPSTNGTTAVVSSDDDRPARVSIDLRKADRDRLSDLAYERRVSVRELVKGLILTELAEADRAR